MLPDGWTRSKLKFSGISVIDGDRGNAYPNGDDFSSEGYCLFLSAKNVTKFGFVFDERQFISQAKHRALRKGAVLKGDIVLTTRGTVGNIGYFINDTLFAAVRINSGMVVLRNENAKLDSAFLYLVLRSPLIEKQVEQMNFGSAQPQLTVQIINNFILPHPPIAEQRRIAEILSTWDRAIAVQERLVANARAQKKALMQTLLTGTKKRLPGFKGEWQRLSFEEVFKVDNEKKTQVQKTQYKALGRTPIVDQGQDFIVGYTDQDETYESVPAIIFGDHTRIIKWIDFPFCPGADGTQILKSTPHIQLQFAFYLLLSADIPNLGYSRHMRALKELTFNVPPDRHEQEKLTELLAAAEDQNHKHETALRQLVAEKSALMQQLLTGKRRVKVEAVEPDLENQNPRLAKERSNGN